MKSYNAYISKGSYIWLLVMLALLLSLYIYLFISNETISLKNSLELVIPLAIIATVWYINFILPKFSIDGKNLIVKKAFSKTEIDINSIQRIETNYVVFNGRVILFSPYKVGLRVVYNKFDDILIHPEQSEEFIEELRNIRPNIAVK